MAFTHNILVLCLSIKISPFWSTPCKQCIRKQLSTSCQKFCSFYCIDTRIQISKISIDDATHDIVMFHLHVLRKVAHEFFTTMTMVDQSSVLGWRQNKLFYVVNCEGKIHMFYLHALFLMACCDFSQSVQVASFKVNVFSTKGIIKKLLREFFGKNIFREIFNPCPSSEEDRGCLQSPPDVIVSDNSFVATENQL